MKTLVLPHYEGRIVRFCDGDTCRVEMAIGFEIIIARAWRLTRIESWELSSSNRPDAERAARTLTERYGGRAVQFCPSTRGFDCYGRLRGEIWLDGAWLADLIVAAGLAWYIK